MKPQKARRFKWWGGGVGRCQVGEHSQCKIKDIVACAGIAGSYKTRCFRCEGPESEVALRCEDSALRLMTSG